MRLLYGVCGTKEISQTPSGKSPALPFHLTDVARAFPLPRSHYVLLVRRSRSPEASSFYHTEALRGGWSVRQLQRQIDSQFYVPEQYPKFSRMFLR